MRDAPKLRPAEPAEAAALTELGLRSKAHWGYPAEFIEACRGELTVDPRRFGATEFAYRVAECGGAVAGFYGIQRLPNRDVDLEALFVDPPFIGQGIGRALLADARTAAATMGGVRLVIQGDPHADAFYRAAGARRIGETESGSISGRFLPLYELLLHG